LLDVHARILQRKEDDVTGNKDMKRERKTYEEMEGKSLSSSSTLTAVARELQPKSASDK